MYQVHKSIGAMFLNTLKKHPHRPYVKWRNEVGEVLQVTYQEMFEHSKTIAGGLASLGIRKNDHISLMAETRWEWIAVDLAVLCLGCATTAIYPTLTPAQIQYIVEDSESRIIFVDDKKNLEKVLDAWAKLPKLEYVIFLDPIPSIDIEKLGIARGISPKKIDPLSWIVALGKDYGFSNPGFFEDCIQQVDEEDLASIVYTSGTTGVPKGVMISHRNFLSDVMMALEVAKQMDPTIAPPDQSALTFLPLSHSFARMAEEFGALYDGACLCLAGGRNPAVIETGFKVFRPTAMAGIPYVYEKIYAAMFEKIKAFSPSVQKIFRKAMEHGKLFNKYLATGEKPPFKDRLKHWFFNKLVYNRIRQMFGGRMVGFISASARLAPEIIEGLWAVGLRILEGYGMTEAGPGTHVMRAWENSDFRPNWPKGKRIHPLSKIGSVGPPFEYPDSPYGNLEQRIAEDGEILLRGPNIMKGYWKKPEETRAALDAEGWLHTGDVGSIDADGYLFLTGRKKLIIKLSTGKIIAPAMVEEKLTLSPFILQAILIGSDERKFLAAFIVPRQEAIRKFAEEQKIPFKSYQELLQNEQVLRKIKTEILDRSRDLSAFETVKKFAIFAKEFNEEEEYLTPTLKYRRNQILTDFADIVEELYDTKRTEDWIIVKRRLTDFHEYSIPA